MDANSIFEYIKAKADVAIELVEDGYNPKVKVEPAGLLSLLKLCKEDAELSFDCLNNQTGIHVEEQIQLYYVLYSYTHHHELIVTCAVSLEAPSAPSVTSLWGGADWLERETYDLLGVLFEGHPNLARIMLPEDWDGHPLRKDYVAPEEYQGIDNRPSEITKSFQVK